MLSGFEATTFTHDKVTHPVYWRGKGPGVVIMHEFPGLTRHVAALGRRVADAGFMAVLPVLLNSMELSGSPLAVAGQFVRLCINREFHLFAKDKSSPVTKWLTGLCKDVYQRCGGPGVGVIGLCLTGGFALSMMVDKEAKVVAPILGEPSLPFALPFGGFKEALSISDKELNQVKERVAEGCTVLGLRFSEDRLCPPERFETLRRELGDGFEAIEIDSFKDNCYGIRRGAHSVLTLDLVDVEGDPTQDALNCVLTRLRERLLVA